MFSSGVLTGHSVVLTKAGLYTLTTVSTTDPTIKGISNSFVIDPGATSSMQIFQQPSATATGGSAFAQQPVIYLYDTYGNPASNDNSTQVTASIGSGSGTIDGTVTRTAVNGVVSFTNLAILGSGVHILSFSSSGRSAVTSGIITLTGMAAPSNLSYTSPNVYTVSQAISPLVPSVTGAVTSYSISPVLPAGLSFDTATGTISGTPTVVGAEGTYIVTASNGGGIATFGILVAVNAPLEVSLTAQTNIAAFGGSTGSVTVAGSGGTSPYEYKIGNGAYQSATSFTGLSAGTYTITIKDRNNVTATVTATIIAPSAALAIKVTSQTSVAVFGAATGSVTVEGSGGTAPYEYKIGNGSYQSGPTFAGLAAGTYTINIKDATGSISSITLTISQPSQALSLVVTLKRNVTAYNGSNGEVVLSASGGTQPYEYKLDNGVYRGSPFFDGLRAKAYIATVKDASGTLETINFIIEQPEQLVVALDTKTTIAGNGLTGSAIKLKAVGGVSPYLYKIGDGEYQSSDTFENLRPGKYVAFVKDSYNTVQTLSVTVSGVGIPNVFTPNGDGKNDVFFIAGLENYDRVELTVFNRWGSEVYRVADYDNKWEGTGLNSGTYYYVIKLIKDSKEDIRKGWVLLKK